MKEFFTTILRFDQLSWKHWLFIFTIFVVAHTPVIRADSGTTNLAVHQAEAFLHGKLNVDQYYWDASVYQGKYYVCFPPFPAVVVTPIVAIFGSVVNSILISLLLTCVSMYILYQILTRLMGSSPGKLWIFLGFFFGTGYWSMVLTSHHVNGFAHVVCTLMILLMLYELTGRQRPVLLGIFLAGAFLSRQMTVFHGLLVVYVMFMHHQNKFESIKRIVFFGLSFSVFALLYLYFNYLRFDNFFETGYSYFMYEGGDSAWPAFLKERIVKYGLFNIAYLPYNLYYMFFKGHEVILGGVDRLAFVGMDQFGTSLLAASPFVICALRAKASTGLKTAYWITLLLIMTGGLLYHNHGWMEVNTQRFSIDFMPILTVLIAWGYSRFPGWLFRGLVAYAIVLNVLSFIVHALNNH